MHHDMLLMYIMRAISADTPHPLLAHLFHLHALVLRHLARVLSALGCPRTIPRQTESDMHIVQLSHLILHASVWHAYCTAITPHSAYPRLTCPACFSSTSHPLETVCTGGLTPPHDHDPNCGRAPPSMNPPRKLTRFSKGFRWFWQAFEGVKVLPGFRSF